MTQLMDAWFDQLASVVMYEMCDLFSGLASQQV